MWSVRILSSIPTSSPTSSPVAFLHVYLLLLLQHTKYTYTPTFGLLHWPFPLEHSFPRYTVHSLTSCQFCAKFIFLNRSFLITAYVIATPSSTCPTTLPVLYFSTALSIS